MEFCIDGVCLELEHGNIPEMDSEMECGNIPELVAESYVPLQSPDRCQDLTEEILL